MLREARRPQRKRQIQSSSAAWVLEIPNDICDEATRYIIKSYTSNVANRRKGPSHTWEYHFRLKKDCLQTTKVPKKHIHSGGVPLPVLHQHGAAEVVRWASRVRRRVLVPPRSHGSLLRHCAAQDWPRAL